MPESQADTLVESKVEEIALVATGGPEPPNHNDDDDKTKDDESDIPEDKQQRTQEELKEIQEIEESIEAGYHSQTSNHVFVDKHYLDLLVKNSKQNWLEMRNYFARVIKDGIAKPLYRRGKIVEGIIYKCLNFKGKTLGVAYKVMPEGATRLVDAYITDICLVALGIKR